MLPPVPSSAQILVLDSISYPYTRLPPLYPASALVKYLHTDIIAPHVIAYNKSIHSVIVNIQPPERDVILNEKEEIWKIGCGNARVIVETKSKEGKIKSVEEYHGELNLCVSRIGY